VEAALLENPTRRDIVGRDRSTARKALRHWSQSLCPSRSDRSSGDVVVVDDDDPGEDRLVGS
jgi:hypothetical protein